MPRDQHVDDPSRRAFFRRGAMLGVSLGTLGTLGAAGALVNRTAASDTPAPAPGDAATSDFMRLLGLRYPIAQAPTSGPAGPELAIAVPDAGALGALALTPESPEAAGQMVRQVRESTAGTFFVNYVLRSEPRSLAQALDAGAPGVQFSWGMPTVEHVRRVRAAGATLGVQVTGAGSTRQALDLGADYLVCQGMEAGGHVQGIRPLDQTLDEVLDQARQVRGGVPVLASGGIATGADIQRVVGRGADGAVLGTRFVATVESRAHPNYKRALVEAGGAADTVCTTCLNKGWPNAPHRILLANLTFQMWEAAGCPPEGQRPGEKDVVGHAPDGAAIERYRINIPVVGTTGSVLEMGTFAGTGVGAVRDLPSAGDLVRRLWGEYEQARE